MPPNKAQTIESQIGYRLWLGFALAVAGSVVVGVFSWSAPARAAVTISDIVVSEIQSDRATISWTTLEDSDTQVVWGNLALGIWFPPLTNSTLTKTHSLEIGPLIPETTYQFIVGSKLESEAEADRTLAPPSEPYPTFTTIADGGGSGSAPMLTSLGVEANGSHAWITFTTDVDAAYTITLNSNSASSPAGDFRDNWPTVVYNDAFGGSAPDLDVSTTYSYMIQLRSEAGAIRNMGPFEFTTGMNDFDYTFTAGACSDATPIGQCNTDGYFCVGGALDLVQNCVVCGFQCAVGQTCQTGGSCTNDPGSGENAYQCNPPSCYGSVCEGGDTPGKACVRNDDCDGGGACTGSDFIEPATGPGCYKSWQKCNANAVIKVQKDRACNKWMTCRTQTDVKNPTNNQTESLCYDLAACSSIGPDGQCAKPLFGKYCIDDPLRFCETGADCDIPICRPASGTWCTVPKEDAGNYEYEPCVKKVPDECVAQSLGTCEEFIPKNVTYVTPDDVQKIRYLSGSINAGLSWTTGVSMKVEGSFPWYYMPQTGSVVPLGNGHFEERETSTSYSADGTQKTVTMYTTRPWSAFGDRGTDGSAPGVTVTAEDIGNQNNPNHVLKIDPTDAVNSGAQAPNQPFSTPIQASYILSFRAKSSSPDGQQVSARFYSPQDDSKPIITADLTSGWKNYVSAPITGLSAENWLQFVRESGSTEPFFIDDVELNIALGRKNIGGSVCVGGSNDGDPCQMNSQCDSNACVASAQAEYLPRSCRLYPREDSLLCEYKDESGIRYKGWYGYCLEHDSKYTDRCVSWWPVDIIGGETDVFGTFGSEVNAGYSGRTPLYYCMEASKGGNRRFSIPWRGACQPALGFCAQDLDDLGPGFLGGVNDKAIFGSCQDSGPMGDGYIDDPDFDYDGLYARLHIAPEDKLYRGSIVSIQFDNAWASHNDWNIGTIVLNEANNWEARYSSANDFQLKAFFNDQTNLLEYIRIYACDASSNDGGFYGYLSFNLREMCTKLVKVVDEEGTSKAWSGRISSGSSFQTRETNYGIDDDFSPFGGVVAPFGVPDDWTMPLFIEAPRTGSTFTYPYQTRAGQPAACNGPCDKRYCVGGGAKDTKICRASDDCRDADGTQGVCVGVGICSKSMKSCSVDWNYFGDGKCRNRGGVEGDYCCSQDDPDDYCVGGAASDRSNQLYSVDDGAQCKFSGAWCKCDTNAPSGDPNACDVLSTGDALCQTYSDSDTCEHIYDNINVHSFALDNLKRLFVQSYGFWTWNSITQHYVPQKIDQDVNIGTKNWMPPTNLCQTCAAPADSLACDANNQCGANTPCTPKSNRGQRNAAAGAASADYCGNRTKVFGFKVNDDSENVTITDGSWVNFKFNTSADSEQQPLSSILIKWSNTEQQSIYFPYAPKSDEDSPHSISHRYFCKQSNLRSEADGGFPLCDPVKKLRIYPCQLDGLCVFQPRVIVQDNWGWCNGVPSDFINGTDCSSVNCAPTEVCEPSYDICVDKDEYITRGCISGSPDNFPPSWPYANGKYSSSKPIEVIVQAST